MLFINTKSLAIIVVLLAITGPLPAQVPKATDQFWRPGKEYRVADSAVGTDGYFLVYVPEDYIPSEQWPVIFYYHGLGGRPTTTIIRQATNDRYCIVVGMSYHAPGMEGYQFMETEDVRIFHHVLGRLKERLNVNERKLYLAGFSKGGFYTCGLLRLLAPELAGAIVLGAASKNIDAAWPDLTGKEVFIGGGQQDGYFEGADETHKRFIELGATVTFERWPDVGHWIGDTAGLRRWIFEQTVDRPTDMEFSESATPIASSPVAPAATPRDANTRVVWWAALAVTPAAITFAVMLFMMSRKQKPQAPQPSEKCSSRS